MCVCVCHCMKQRFAAHGAFVRYIVHDGKRNSWVVLNPTQYDPTRHNTTRHQLPFTPPNTSTSLRHSQPRWFFLGVSIYTHTLIDAMTFLMASLAISAAFLYLVTTFGFETSSADLGSLVSASAMIHLTTTQPHNQQPVGSISDSHMRPEESKPKSCEKRVVCKERGDTIGGRAL